MTEREIRDALKRAGGVDPEARERSWRVVRAAFDRRSPQRRRPSWVSVLVASAVLAMTGVGVAAASATDGGVGRWVRSVLGVGEREAKPALVRIPGGGRLLVEAAGSAWVVSEDGSKRRLGSYSGASWSPRGLFVIAWRGRVLTAVDPRGEVRWSLARPNRVALARWAPVDGFRIAYLSGGRLRIVNGDGTGDRGYGRAAPSVAPAWRPDDDHVLAYVDARRRVNVVAVDERRRLWRSSPLSGVLQLEWSPDGRRLLALTPRRLLLFDAEGGRRASHAIPAAIAARAAAWAPRGPRIAVVGHVPATRQSSVVLVDLNQESARAPLFSGPGRLGAPAWSPDGRRLLVTWPAADQWLFLDPRGRGRLTAVANIASQFGPGATSPGTPRSVEWCCSTRSSTRP